MYRNQPSATQSLFLAFNDNSADTQPVIRGINDGVGYNIYADTNGNGVSFKIDSEATTQPAAVIDIVDGDTHLRLVGDSGNSGPAEGDLWRESDGLKYYDGATEHNLINSPNILYFTCGENSALDPGSEWSCGGNGETNQNFYFWDNVTAKGIALDCNTGTGEAIIVIQDDEVNTICNVTSTTTNDANTCDVDIDAGSWVRPYTVSDSGHSQCVVTMRFITR